MPSELMEEEDKKERCMDLVGEAVNRAVGSECLIIFFGSILNNRFGVTSDIDVAVLCSKALTPLDILKIEEELDKLPILRDIDLIDIRSVKDSEFIKAILKGKVWKSSPELLRDLEELSTGLER